MLRFALLLLLSGALVAALPYEQYGGAAWDSQNADYADEPAESQQRDAQETDDLQQTQQYQQSDDLVQESERYQQSDDLTQQTQQSGDLTQQFQDDQNQQTSDGEWSQVPQGQPGRTRPDEGIVRYSEDDTGRNNGNGRGRQGGDGNTDGNTNGNTDGNTNGNNDRNTNGNTDGNTNRNTNGNTDGNTNGNTGGNSGNTDGNTNGNTDWNPSGNSGNNNGNVGVVDGAPRIPPGYDKLPKNAFTPLGYYKVYTTPKTWAEAIVQCAADGAELAIAASQQEATEMGKLYKGVKASVKKSSDSNLFFVSASDLHKENDFVTLAGQRFSKGFYHRWQVGEPNNHKKSEHCVLSNETGLYWDGNCVNKYAFICRYKPDPCAVPPRPAAFSDEQSQQSYI